MPYYWLFCHSARSLSTPASSSNYLATPKDRDTITAGVAAMRPIFQAPPWRLRSPRRSSRARIATTTTNYSISSAAADRRSIIPSDLPRGPGSKSGGRRAAARGRLCGTTCGRCPDHAAVAFWQHQCRNEHDQRQRHRNDPRGLKGHDMLTCHFKMASRRLHPAQGPCPARARR